MFKHLVDVVTEVGDHRLAILEFGFVVVFEDLLVHPKAFDFDLVLQVQTQLCVHFSYQSCSFLLLCVVPNELRQVCPTVAFDATLEPTFAHQAVEHRHPLLHDLSLRVSLSLSFFHVCLQNVIFLSFPLLAFCQLLDLLLPSLSVLNDT